VREIFSPEHIKHRARVRMIESQHVIWRRKFHQFVDFLEQQDPEDFGPHFAAQRQVVTQLYELCRDPATFDTHCTRENLRIICDFTRRIAGTTANEQCWLSTPDWMYVVTQIHLFVLEAECRRCLFNRVDLLNRTDPDETVRNVEYMVKSAFSLQISGHTSRSFSSRHLARTSSRGGFPDQLHAPQCVNACTGVRRRSPSATRRPKTFYC
jgi:hypothetical protein